MSHGVPYFTWRDGRPRWTPGPDLRARGFKGRDLKSERGEWLPLGPALDIARDLNERAGVKEKAEKPEKPETSTTEPAFKCRNGKPRKPVSRSIPGFVYFLLSGDHIKIGFSKNPFARSRNLSTSMASAMKSLAAIKGSLYDEKRLHYALREHRTNGEWFKATREVRKVMMECIEAGEIPTRLYRTDDLDEGSRMRPINGSHEG